MENFSGKLAVITGAASGIGRALALHCAKEGMHLALADMDEAKLATLTDSLSARGVKFLSATVNVADGAAVKDFSEACFDRFGHVGLLFNNAGILRVGHCWEHSLSDWQKLLSINLMGVVNGINAFVPRMIASGNAAHIINTGSIGSLVAAPAMAQYTASKMAVRGLTETLALDLASVAASIDVSLLCPGPVLTSIGDSLLGVDSKPESTEEHLMAGEPGFMTPEVCAERVFSAIRERRFWIFTHPFKRYYQKKTDAILEGLNPVYEEVTFDF